MVGVDGEGAIGERSSRIVYHLDPHLELLGLDSFGMRHWPTGLENDH